MTARPDPTGAVAAMGAVPSMIDELRQGPLLGALDAGQRARVAARARRVELDTGQHLFMQGDAAHAFYLVRQGQIQLYRSAPDGANKVIEILSPGQTFAEALMFLKAPTYPVCASALSPTALIAIDAGDFARMLQESVETCFVMLGTLSQRLHGLIGEIDTLTLHSATGRVARYLLARIPPDRPVFQLEVRKGVLASRLSVQPETFSRVVRQLSERGILAVAGSEVRVLDRAALAEAAEA